MILNRLILFLSKKKIHIYLEFNPMDGEAWLEFADTCLEFMKYLLKKNHFLFSLNIFFSLNIDGCVTQHKPSKVINA